MPDEPFGRIQAEGDYDALLVGREEPTPDANPELVAMQERLAKLEADNEGLRREGTELRGRLEKAQDDLLAGLARRPERGEETPHTPAGPDLSELSSEGQLIVGLFQQGLESLRQEMATAKESLRTDLDRGTQMQLAVDRIKSKEHPEVFKVVGERAARLVEQRPGLGIEGAYAQARKELQSYVDFMTSQAKAGQDEGAGLVASEKPGSVQGGKPKPKTFAEAFDQAADEIGLPK